MILGNNNKDDSQARENNNGRDVDCFCPDSIRGPNETHVDVCHELRTLLERFRVAEANVGEVILQSTQKFQPFGHHHSPQLDYIIAISELAEALFRAASTHGSDRLAEKALRYSIISIGRSQSISGATVLEMVPYLLLQLGRYDELWVFCRYFLGNRWTLSDEEQRLALSGEFPFEIREGDHLLDPCEVYSRETLQGEGSHVLPFLVALFLLKAKLSDRRQQEREEHAEKIALFLDTDGGQVLEQVSVPLKEMAKGNKHYKDPENERIEPLMNAIHQRNATILPAMVFPEPLLQEIDDLGGDMDGLHFPRCPSEAWVTLMVSRAELDRTPKAQEMLRARFGDRPRYHHTPFDMTAEELQPQP